MARKNLFIALAAAGVLLLAAGCSSTTAASVKPAGDRKAAPDFSLKDDSGQTVKLSDYKGKVVLLNFWATWCAPCKAEIPWFIDFEQKHKNEGFAVLGVSLDEDGWDAVRPFVKSEKINYRILMGTEQLAQLYGGVEALPTTFIIDREGRIASTHVGLVTRGEYQNDINHLLQSKTSATAVPGAAVPAVLLGAAW